MRGLTRVLVMFAPMIIRNVSKYWRQYQSKKQQESHTQEPYNEAEDKINPDGTTYKNDDLV